jgi:hypothetical protein
MNQQQQLFELETELNNMYQQAAGQFTLLVQLINTDPYNRNLYFSMLKLHLTAQGFRNKTLAKQIDEYLSNRKEWGASTKRQTPLI